MIPIHLDPAFCAIGLVGRGALAARRLAWLEAGGAGNLTLWSDDPSPDFAIAAGARLRIGLPGPGDLERLNILWIADLPPEAAAILARAARARRPLVNVEDVLDQCDFHTPSVVRRGRLTLTAGTAGASPAVAKAARARLETSFPEAWGPALEEIAAARAPLKAQGLDANALNAYARAELAARGLITPPAE